MAFSKLEALAEERLSPEAFRFFAAGAGAERTLRANVEAYGRWQLACAAAQSDVEPAIETLVLGQRVGMPLVVAPVAFQHIAHPEGDRATARAAASAGVIVCQSAASVTPPRELIRAAPAGRYWMQIQCFTDSGLTRSLIDEAVEAGFEALVFTADTPYPGRRSRRLKRARKLPGDVRLPAWAVGRSEETISEISADDASWIDDLALIKGHSPLPVVVKGTLTVPDALLACDAGVAGIIVSNHGGRHVDGVPATLDVLPAIADAVAGRTELLIDGGIRNGADVVKSLALGARAVLAGRAIVWGLAVGGEAGVHLVLETFAEEIRRALSRLGCDSPSSVARTHVVWHET